MLHRTFFRMRVVCKDCHSRHRCFVLTCLALLSTIMFVIQIYSNGPNSDNLDWGPFVGAGEKIIKIRPIDRTKELVESAKSFIFDKSWQPTSVYTPQMKKIEDFFEDSGNHVRLSESGKVIMPQKIPVDDREESFSSIGPKRSKSVQEQQYIERAKAPFLNYISDNETQTTVALLHSKNNYLPAIANENSNNRNQSFVAKNKVEDKHIEQNRDQLEPTDKKLSNNATQDSKKQAVTIVNEHPNKNDSNLRTENKRLEPEENEKATIEKAYVNNKNDTNVSSSTSKVKNIPPTSVEKIKPNLDSEKLRIFNEENLLPVV